MQTRGYLRTRLNWWTEMETKNYTLDDRFKFRKLWIHKAKLIDDPQLKEYLLQSEHRAFLILMEASKRQSGRYGYLQRTFIKR